MTLPRDESFPSFLDGKDPAELLNRLAEGDALGIEEMAQERVMDLAFMVDPGRVAARSLARIAYDAAIGVGRNQPFSKWLLRRIDTSVEEVIDEDLYSEFSNGTATDGPYYTFYEDMGALLDTDPPFARRLCCVFNSFTLDTRHPFFEVVVLGVSLEDYAMAADISLDALQAHLLDTITKMVRIAQDPGEDFPV